MQNQSLNNRQKIVFARREYLRQWREKNGDRIKKYREKFWLKKFEEMRESQINNSCKV